MTRLELLRRRLGFGSSKSDRAEPVEALSFFSKGKGNTLTSSVRTEEGICIHE